MGIADEMLCFSLYAATRATAQAYRSLLEPWNLTYPQYLVLVLLWDSDHRAVRDLGESLQLDSGTLSPLLRRMEQAGYLDRARSARDERVVIVSLTGRGRALKNDLAHVPSCMAESFGVSLEQARELTGTLRLLTARMHATAGALSPAETTSGQPPAAATTKGNAMEVLYTAEALSTGAGRNGHVTTTDGRVDFDMAIPKEMGGSGNGANPEELFAAGYAACFHSALQGVARAQKIAIHDSTVGGRVSIGPNDQGGFQLAVQLEVVIPDLPHDQAQALADAAHQVCPYSNATRGNIDVTITVSDD